MLILFLIDVKAMRSTYKGFLSFDTMLSFIPILLIAIYLISYANFISEKNQNELHSQILHNKLVSVSELVVNDLAAKKTDSVKPNWIDENELAKVNADELKKSMGLTELHVGWQPDGKNCIYRIVVFGEDKEIRQLFICGE